jgi:tetratricopeptide (TPR) repeat protein
LNLQSEKINEQHACQSIGRQSRKLHTLLICSSLVLATIIAFEQIRHNQFVYDDLLYITQNPPVTNGVSVESIKWAFTTTYAGNWHPVTWLSHILDCQLFKLNPLWPHLENLLLHIVNTLLLFWILKSMTGSLWRSGFVAAAFALHPVHVESVAWVAERKDLLSGLFWMLTIAAYARYARKPATGRYLLVIIFFVLGLMSKPMIVTLPFVLLLMDYWPLARLEKLQPYLVNQSDNQYKKASIRFLLAEKLPLFILAIASSLITFIAQRSSGAMDILERMPLDARAANALISYTTYISQMIYPARLAVLYPHSGEDFPLWQALGSLGIIVLITIIVLLLGRRKPYIFLGWLWYLGTLLPVIGLVQVGAQGMADRYTYLPSIGFFIMVAWGAAELAAKRRFLKVGLGISAVIVIALLIFGTRKQMEYWQNNFTLFERALVVTGDNPAMLYNMGVVLETENQPDLAIRCYRCALKFKPDYFEAYNNLGSILSTQGNYDDAAAHIRRALQINPEYPLAHNNLGMVLVAQGNLSEALVHFRRAVELMPDSVEMRHNLASVLQAKGELDEAISQYRKALQLKPGYLLSLNALAKILITHPNPEMRNADEAVPLAERAAKLTRHQNPATLEILAAAYAAKGQFDHAVTTIQQAITLTSTANNAEFSERLRNKLELYKQKKPPQIPIQ